MYSLGRGLARQALVLFQLAFMATVAIIPARGGSKGVPRKNLRKVEGVPLVARAVRVGLAAPRVDRVIVTTDDEEIASCALAAGGEVIMRPPVLAADDTPTVPVLCFVLDRLTETGWDADVVVLLEPTSPFRTPAIVDACIAKLDDPRVGSALTVTQLERNPYNIFVVEGDRAERFIQAPEGAFTRRQQFAHLKRVNGCVYAARASSIRDGRLIVEPVRVVEMTDLDSINIDTPIDLELARIVAALPSGNGAAAVG
jgi:CMP-N,N'-diacetyllegionaminic acid synthase